MIAFANVCIFKTSPHFHLSRSIPSDMGFLRALLNAHSRSEEGDKDANLSRCNKETINRSMETSGRFSCTKCATDQASVRVGTRQKGSRRNSWQDAPSLSVSATHCHILWGPSLARGPGFFPQSWGDRCEEGPFRSSPPGMGPPGLIKSQPVWQVLV